VIVLDTNVLSELARPDPDEAVLAWVAAQRRTELCTTTISEAELAYGLALLSKGRRRDALAQATARLLGEGLGGRVLPFDRAAAAAQVAATARPWRLTPCYPRHGRFPGVRRAPRQPLGRLSYLSRRAAHGPGRPPHDATGTPTLASSEPACPVSRRRTWP